MSRRFRVRCSASPRNDDGGSASCTPHADRVEQARTRARGILRARDLSLRKGSRRAHADASACGLSRAASFPAGRSIATTTGSASGRCGCRGGSIVSTDDHLGKSVYPDIVVHQRAIPNNLLAIEVRKASNHQPPEHDRHKLRGLTDPHLWFAYRVGISLTLGKKSVRVGGLCRRRASTSRCRPGSPSG